MTIAITPSQMPAPESALSRPVAAVAAAPPTAWPGSSTVTAAEGPTAVGPLSADSCPGFSAGPVHGLTLPSAEVCRVFHRAVPDSKGVPSTTKSAKRFGGI